MAENDVKTFKLKVISNGLWLAGWMCKNRSLNFDDNMDIRGRASKELKTERKTSTLYLKTSISLFRKIDE